MRPIKDYDAGYMVQTIWTARESEIRDDMLSAYWKIYLMPAQVVELQRCRRFMPGDRIREITLTYVHNTWNAVKLARQCEAAERLCSKCRERKPSRGSALCHLCKPKASKDGGQPVVHPNQ